MLANKYASTSLYQHATIEELMIIIFWEMIIIIVTAVETSNLTIGELFETMVCAGEL
jgi:hypothetical protein